MNEKQAAIVREFGEALREGMRMEAEATTPAYLIDLLRQLKAVEEDQRDRLSGSPC